MNDWWPWIVAYLVLVVAIKVRWHLTVGKALFVALLPFVWPLLLIFLGGRLIWVGTWAQYRLRRESPPAPTSSEV